MKNPYLINITDKENWLFPTNGYNSDGTISEEQRTIVMPQGMDRRYCFTDSLMRKSENAGGPIMLHEHQQGYETFFVESSSI